MKYVLSLNISGESLVCRSCRDDVTRVLSNSSHVPKWRKVGVETSDIYCCVKHCTHYSFTQTNMGSSDELKHVQQIEFAYDTIPTPTPLCKSHYHVLY